MAKGGVVFQDAEELKARSEKKAQEWDGANPLGVDTRGDDILCKISEAMDVAKSLPKARDIKEVSYVMLFCKRLAEVMAGKNVKFSYNLPKDFAGEAASVTVRGRSLEITDLKLLYEFKQKIGAIEITDHTDGTISMCFSFFNTLKRLTEE